MKRQIEALLSRALVRWVDAVRAHAQLSVIACLAVSVLCLVHTVTTLGINADNLSLIPERLPSRQAHERFIEHFPNLEAALFVVVDAATPELARQAASDILAGLRADSAHFTDAYWPGGGEFYEHNGLLYLDADELDDFADRLARIQPLVGEIESDPRIAHLVGVVEDGLTEIGTDADLLRQWQLVLDRLGEATTRIDERYPIPVSWEEVLFDGSPHGTSTRRSLIVHPILDFGDIFHGGQPMQRVWAIAAAYGHVPERGVEVRITGNPALNYEEMISFVWDLATAGAFCFGLVALILYRAFGSLRLTIATLLTLLLGLVWTAEFATIALGELNLVSITFTILFIGLGVDFGIHIGIGYGALRQTGLDHEAALREAAGGVGATLFFCTLTTAIGFYVFVPTDYRGVAELGLIAGSGMFILLFLTLTFLPALISSWLKIDAQRDLRRPLRLDNRHLARLTGHGRAIVVIAALAGVAGLLVLPDIYFDTNVVGIRDPGAQSVRAFEDLMSESTTSPWYLNVLMPDRATADALADEVEALPEVDFALSVSRFVPEGQDEKLEILADIGFLFDPIRTTPTPDTKPDDPATTLAAIAALRDALREGEYAEGDPDFAVTTERLADRLDAFLARTAGAADPARALDALEALTLDAFPEQIARLRSALAAQPIRLADLPPEITTRMVGRDGTHRVQIFPAIDLLERGGLETFVGAVQAATPNSAGVPLNLVEFGRITETSFTQALLSAMLMISILLFVLWRNPGDVLFVMAPLTLGAILTGATIILLGYAFNFANIVVIPLLFGVGVDSAIHIVQNRKNGVLASELLTGTPAARAIFFSALTTGVSFGSLGLAAHRGLASLGVILAIGLAYSLLAVLIVLPALLALRRGGRARQITVPPGDTAPEVNPS